MRLFAALLLVSVGCAAAASSRKSAPPRLWVDGPHGRLRVDDAGSGDAAGGSGSGAIPILFVHGNGGNRTQWSAALARERAVRRAVAMDLSGMGESDAGIGPVRVEGYADDVQAVADALGLRRFVLVGHSYGGSVVAAYAGAHPERLAGLVFADCAGDLHRTPEASLEPMRRGLAQDYVAFTGKWFDGILAGAQPETREAVMASLRRTPPEVFIAATNALYRFDFDAALSRYPGPKLSIASALFDNPVAVHKTVPGIPVRRIEGASHWLMMDRPEEFGRLLDEFLASLPR